MQGERFVLCLWRRAQHIWQAVRTFPSFFLIDFVFG